jgi:small subunit ribosomal protein S17
LETKPVNIQELAKDDPKLKNISFRGKTFVGKVVSAKAHKSATIQWERRIYVPKYERYEKRRSKINVHNPPSINAKEGDTVRVMETRPLSKTKNFVIIEKLGEKQE